VSFNGLRVFGPVGFAAGSQIAGNFPDHPSQRHQTCDDFAKVIHTISWNFAEFGSVALDLITTTMRGPSPDRR